MAGQAASRDFAGLLHVFFTPAVGPLSDSQPAWVCRSVNHALQIRPGMEAVFRCEPEAGRRLPPVLDGAGDTRIAAGVLTPASDDNDANAAGDAVCEKPPK